MAKVYESDIDPDEFIRSFREESSNLSSLKKKPSADTGDAAKAPATPVPAPQPHDTVPDTKSADTDLDAEFMERFVTDKVYMRVPSPYRSLMVDIDREHVRIIKGILYNGKCSLGTVKGYVALVLEEHFKKYESMIKKLNNQ